MTNPLEIYVLLDSLPHGPYTPELVRQYLKSGQLQPPDLAAYAGSADWVPLSALVQSWERSVPASGTRLSSATPKPLKVNRVLALMVAVVVLLASVGGLVWWRLAGNSRQQVKDVAPLEPGLPKTLVELDAWYAQPPEGQNAATFCLKGFEAMQITDADRNSKDLPLIGKGALPSWAVRCRLGPKPPLPRSRSGTNLLGKLFDKEGSSNNRATR